MIFVSRRPACFTNTSQLTIALAAGGHYVILKGLELKPEAIFDLQLPIRLVRGYSEWDFQL